MIRTPWYELDGVVLEDEERMVPTIGVMIGGYIIFRCFEAFCRNVSQFGSRGEQRFIQVMAVIGILVTAFLTADLLASGTSTLPQVK